MSCARLPSTRAALRVAANNCRFAACGGKAQRATQPTPATTSRGAARQLLGLRSRGSGDDDDDNDRDDDRDDGRRRRCKAPETRGAPPHRADAPTCRPQFLSSCVRPAATDANKPLSRCAAAAAVAAVVVVAAAVAAANCGRVAFLIAAAFYIHCDKPHF